jgi:hypothetical protein
MAALQLVAVDADALAALQPPGVPLAEQQRHHDDRTEDYGCQGDPHGESLFAYSLDSLDSLDSLIRWIAYSLIRWSLIRWSLFADR